MADRLMKAHDTWPPLKGQATDESGLVDLTTADSMRVLIKSDSFLIDGTPVPIDPPEADADGVHHWNWQYLFQVDDTANIGTYNIELEVTWSPGNVQTFPNTGSSSLQIVADLG